MYWWFLASAIAVFSWDFTTLGLGLDFGGRSSICDVLSGANIVLAIWLIQRNPIKNLVDYMLALVVLSVYSACTLLMNAGVLGSEVLQYLQFQIRMWPFFSLVVIGLIRTDFNRKLLLAIRDSSVAIVIIGYLLYFLMIAGIEFEIFDYVRGRSYLNLPQATSIFYEPAAYSQFLVAMLFINFRSVGMTKLDLSICASFIISIILSQSVGGAIGLLVWFVVIFSPSIGSTRSGHMRNISVFLLIAAAGAVILFFIISSGNSRYGGLFRQDAFGILQSGSGAVRVTGEFMALLELARQGFFSLMFGLGDFGSRDFRMSLGYSADVSGNGLVEIILRYGVIYLTFLISASALLLKKVKRFVRFWLFFAVIAQIDGAIAKPWIWFYLAIFMVVEVSCAERPQNRLAKYRGFVQETSPR
ncbi:MAG: hypothetical protein H3C27_15020 [Opitutaceae bacterium]|nr:hypothetical protein [Opitutaceae bacterium]